MLLNIAAEIELGKIPNVTKFRKAPRRETPDEG
jgi:hypothetical protein